MNNRLNNLSDPTRRQFVERLAASAFALNLMPTQAAMAQNNLSGKGFGKAKRVIVIQLDGGMSHIDTFDPKTGGGKGPGDAINTSADFQITHYLPGIAKIANQICVIRSMEAKVGAHEQAKYLMRTAYAMRGTIMHPNIGAWAQHYLGKSHPTMPSNVCVNMLSNQGNGFFPSTHTPLSIGNPNKGLKNISPHGGDDKLKARMQLLNQLDMEFRNKRQDASIQAYNGYYDDAMTLLNSEELKAFDLSHESQTTRNEYGNSKLGQGCLLARRLVSSGVRFVEIQQSGWDFHNDLQRNIPGVTSVFDRAYTALITDLDQRGMLDDTLVVVTTEFGRTPNFKDTGRGHHALCFSTVLAGGGVKKGYAHGASDQSGYEPTKDGVTIGAFHATIGWAAGLPLIKEYVTENGRPFKVGNGVSPVMDVFA